MKKKFALIVLLVLISTPKVFAVCNTMVPPGVISGKTWTAAGSPYCVEGKITVNNLTIEPAVRVEFTGNFELEVVGVLTAVGTVGNSIIFTTTADNDDGWKGIYFNISLPGSEIAHVIIEKSVDSGLEINNSQPTIRDCTIRDNEQTSLNRGGGIWTNAPLTLNRCTVMDNSVSVVNGTVFGGGIYSESDLVLRDTSVLKNKASASAPYSPSSATAHGGGIYVEGTLKLERSVVDSNLTDARCAAGYTHAYSRGGGFYAMGKATILNSFITRNEAFGAGFCSYIRSGGGIYLEAEGELINSTVADNITEGLKDTIASVKVVNSIFWKNTVNQIAGSSDVSYSDVQGGWPGTGNIDLNPLFKTPDPADPMYDVHLDSFSPCIDKGTSTGAPNDDIDGDSRPQKSGFDMGADEVVVVEVIAYTPVTPCRIADTRKAGGAIAAGGIHSYNVWGPVASQGGNPVGCPSPKGEPRAVHVNVTSVPLGNGWITVYPYNSTAPTASLVNYRSDAQNVANSGTIKTCFNCAKDINIKSGGGTTHVIIDVLGYYYSKP